MQSAPREKLKQLVEIYAIRTRQLSEAIAVLAGHVTAERQIDETVTEIRRLSCLVEEAGMDLLAFVEPPPAESPNE